MLDNRTIVAFLAALGMAALMGACSDASSTTEAPQWTEAVQSDSFEFHASNLQNYLSAIQPGTEHLYGFENRDEIARAELSNVGYQMWNLDADESMGRIRFFVTVDNEPRLFLSLDKAGDGYTYGGLGGTGLAKEVGAAQSEFASKGGEVVAGRILRDFTYRGDFIEFNPASDSAVKGRVFPLSSGSRALMQSAGIPMTRALENSYSLNELNNIRLQAR